MKAPNPQPAEYPACRKNCPPLHIFPPLARFVATRMSGWRCIGYPSAARPGVAGVYLHHAVAAEYLPMKRHLQYSPPEYPDVCSDLRYSFDFSCPIKNQTVVCQPGRGCEWSRVATQ
ncbi:Fe-S-cluster-containing dehydrogenase component [Pseudomonas syringae pv. actinidiae]|uniref:Fe-S-cluster-containing dehydrogenase component n=1 Tax=Pseudomonas syringae pv. actinidiae TaxID=103796 RepID=A0AAN4TPV0_PSESF|nr:Fe-S-cluster-containing dehydrogenase component [Pseudomonas syringae pv. actinidiae]